MIPVMFSLRGDLVYSFRSKKHCCMHVGSENRTIGSNCNWHTLMSYRYIAVDLIAFSY